MSSERPDRSPFRHDGALLRRFARFGATRMPKWWLRYSPPAFGLAAAVLVPEARRTVRENLQLTRGKAGALRETLDVAHTFTTYAGCLAESLAGGSANYALPEVTVTGREHLREARAHGRGVVLATAHTAGWEIVGPVMERDHGLRVMMAMEPERDREAARLHDAARAERGLGVLHVGSDPLASLALLHHVRGGGAAALQMDRVVFGQRTRGARIFDVPARIPEGLLRLAQVTGAMILPAFCARVGFGRYIVEVSPPIAIPRRATEAELDRAAQTVADAMTRFVRAHPTQWFRFRKGAGDGLGL